MTHLKDSVLILNKSWLPIGIQDVKKVLKKIFRKRAYVVDVVTYETYSCEQWINMEVKEGDIFIQASHSRIKVPEVIVLTGYGKLPEQSVKLTKRNIFKRDKYICQYTGKRVDPKNADIDHVIPKSKGGKNTWDNLVVSSIDVNRRKGSRTPEEAGLKLIKKPRKPLYRSLLLDPRKEIPEAWKNFF
ncbi:MAG TPA: HNH endonuclease [Candidatus Paceibacterota bacterium]|nr:HNH endonuclease [Candidatus Paceibacterota bacterium]